MDKINRSYELELSINDKNIVSNLNELKTALESDFGKYSKLVIPAEQMDEKTYKELKAQRTTMNKLYKSFNDERIARVKSIQNVLKTAKSMVDDSIQVLKDGSENVSKILNDYDEMQKEKAYKKAEEIFQEVTSSTTDFKELNLNLVDIVNVDIEKFESLLYKPKSIKEYFVAKLNTIIADLNAIEHSEYKEKEYIKDIYFKQGMNISKAFQVYFEEKSLRDKVSEQIGSQKKQDEQYQKDKIVTLKVELDKVCYEAVMDLLADLDNKGHYNNIVSMEDGLY